MCTGLGGARGALLACNILLMIVALACMGGGVVLIIGRNAYGDQLDYLRDSLSTVVAAWGNANLDTSALDVQFITLPLGVTLLVSGALILALCILGIIAASGRFYKFVIVYVVLLSCLYFSQIVVLICAYIDRDPFDSTVKRYLKDQLDEYTDIDGTDSYTLGWNAVMSEFKCCGVDDYLDFPTYPKGTQTTPKICCLDPNNPADCADAGKFQTNTYFNKGCYNHMWDFVTTNSVLIIVIVFLIVLLEFLCLFFAVWIICFRKSEGISKVGDYERYN